MFVGFYTNTFTGKDYLGLPVPNYIKRYKNSTKARLIYKIADYKGGGDTKQKSISYLTDIMNILLFTNSDIVGYINPQKLNLKDYEPISDKVYHIADFDNLISSNVKKEMNYTIIKIQTKLEELKAQNNYINMLWHIVCYYGVFLSRVNKISKSNCDKIVNFTVYNLGKVGHNINNKKYIEDTKVNLLKYALSHREELKRRDRERKRQIRASILRAS
jgi:hypothetical protein